MKNSDLFFIQTWLRIGQSEYMIWLEWSTLADQRKDNHFDFLFRMDNFHRAHIASRPYRQIIVVSIFDDTFTWIPKLHLNIYKRNQRELFQV